MLGQQRVDTLGFEPVAHRRVDLECHVVVLAGGIGVQIGVHRVVPALAQPTRARAGVVHGLVRLHRRFAALGVRAIVHRAGNHVPAAVDICKVSAVERRAGADGEKQRRDRNQLVVELACLKNFVRLHSDLQAAAAHAESHGIHVNMVGLCRTELGFGVFGEEFAVVRDRRIDKWTRGVFVVVDRDINAYFGPTALANVGRQRGEANVHVDNIVGKKERATRRAIRLERWVGKRRVAHAESREGGKRHRNLVLLQVLADNHTAHTHVFLDPQQVAWVGGKGLARRAFDHVAPVLRVKRRAVPLLGYLRAILEHAQDLALAQRESRSVMRPIERDDHVFQFVAPRHSIACTPSEMTPEREELLDAVVAHMLCERHRIVPV